MTIIQQLAKIEKKQVRYKNEDYQIQSYTIERGLIAIQTDKEKLFINQEDFTPQDFEIMQQEPTAQVQQIESNPYLATPTQQDAQGMQIFNNTNSIINTLMDSINNIKNGTNIEQAQTINDLSKTVIEAVKTQVLAVKVMQGVK